MKWGAGSLEFARPIRWLCCLWGNDILPVIVDGIKSDRFSYGNRYLGIDKQVRISSPEIYVATLRDNKVMADRPERLQTIRHQLESLFHTTDTISSPAGHYRVDLNEALLETVTDLVEYPTAVVAEFEAHFLSLPPKIITSTISQNQKYFAVTDAEGKLTNRFVFISNGNPACSDIIRQGNEKVVKPRLTDALWYYQEDTKKPLKHYTEGLRSVVFQAKLGTVWDKTQRIILVAAYICNELALSDADKLPCLRTAQLCKADLVTLMLGEKEFTKLQGYIGMYYALASGEDKEVATGIYEHYMPRGQNDSLPSTLTGSIVAIADKLDTVCGIIGIGMSPTGSADPFALRRAANGVVQIIAERNWKLNLLDLIHNSLQQLPPEHLTDSAGDAIEKFFHQRVNWYLQQCGINYDIIDSVMDIDYANILHLLSRARALQAYKSRDDFSQLVIGFKRVANILSKSATELPLSLELLTEPAERQLHLALQSLQAQVTELLNKPEPDYYQVLEALVSVRPDIDRFFDEVLVNAEDPILRTNRHALLHRLKQVFLTVADISLLVLEGEEQAKK